MRIRQVKEEQFGYYTHDKKYVDNQKSNILKWISDNVENYQYYTIDRHNYSEDYIDVIIRVYEGDE